MTSRFLWCLSAMLLRTVTDRLLIPSGYPYSSYDWNSLDFQLHVVSWMVHFHIPLQRNFYRIAWGKSNSRFLPCQFCIHVKIIISRFIFSYALKASMIRMDRQFVSCNGPLECLKLIKYSTSKRKKRVVFNVDSSTKKFKFKNFKFYLIQINKF